MDSWSAEPAEPSAPVTPEPDWLAAAGERRAIAPPAPPSDAGSVAPSCAMSEVGSIVSVGGRSRIIIHAGFSDVAEDEAIVGPTEWAARDRAGARRGGRERGQTYQRML
jgi:hypothetical protein